MMAHWSDGSSYVDLIPLRPVPCARPSYFGVVVRSWAPPRHWTSATALRRSAGTFLAMPWLLSARSNHTTLALSLGSLAADSIHRSSSTPG